MKILTEGGNIFKTADGTPLTQRISQSDVMSTVNWLEQATGLDFTSELGDDGYPVNWLGTTGRKSSSGDLDLSVDESGLDKDSLIQTLLSNGVDKNSIKKSGDSVHVKAPIAGDPKNGFVQADLMFGEPKWQAFSMKGAPEESKLTGMSRHVILASIVSALHPELKWSYKHGLVDRVTNTTIPDGKSAKKLSEVTGIPIAKLNTADDILDAVSKRHDYDQLIAAARETLAKSDIQLPEAAPLPGTAKWFRKYSNKFV
jgi:hypothetical protein